MFVLEEEIARMYVNTWLTGIVLIDFCTEVTSVKIMYYTSNALTYF